MMKKSKIIKVINKNNKNTSTKRKVSVRQLLATLDAVLAYQYQSLFSHNIIEEKSNYINAAPQQYENSVKDDIDKGLLIKIFLNNIKQKYIVKKAIIEEEENNTEKKDGFFDMS